MKSKIDKLRYQDFEGTTVTLNMFIFLKHLNLKSAVEAANEFQELLDDEFCSECKVDHGSCECNSQDYDCLDDGDRAYDAWKDAQLENKEE